MMPMWRWWGISFISLFLFLLGYLLEGGTGMDERVSIT
jgi:hypothetical protein